MIPNKIHYCWFGQNPLPELALKCIESWKRYFPDYEIKEWNESNFNLENCNYIREAYRAKKWAFVSDYARFWILYHEGGIYFDTDVEVINPFDDILNNGAFIGVEPDNTNYGINPGLGLGIEPKSEIIKEIMEFYETRHFFRQNGDLDTTTIVEYTTNIFLKHGWIRNDKLQCIDHITIYPSEFFCPMDYVTRKMTITQNTHSIHHYTASWYSKIDEKISRIMRLCVNVFGNNLGRKISRVVDLPFRAIRKKNSLGYWGTARFVGQKIWGSRKD